MIDLATAERFWRGCCGKHDCPWEHWSRTRVARYLRLLMRLRRLGRRDCGRGL